MRLLNLSGFKFISGDVSTANKVFLNADHIRHIAVYTDDSGVKRTYINASSYSYWLEGDQSKAISYQLTGKEL